MRLRGSLLLESYRRLIGLYPAAFRARYGDEVTQLFEDQVRDAMARGGRRGVARTAIRAVGDVIVTATEERVRGSRTVAHSAEVAPAGWTRALGLAGVVGGLLLVAAFLPTDPWTPELFNLRLVLFNVGAIAIVLAVHRRNAAVSRGLSLAAAIPAIVANAWYLVMVVLALGRPQPPLGDPDFRLVMFGAGVAMWLADALFAVVTLRLGVAVRLGALALAAGSLLAFTGLDRLELVSGDGAWFFVPAALIGIALSGAGWIALGLDVAIRRTPRGGPLAPIATDRAP
jgi:hypothetical protein